MKLVVFGLTVSSSWGNGHATLWRGLIAALARRGVRTTFFERDVDWYRTTRDLHDLERGRLVLYRDWDDVRHEAEAAVREADAAIVTSYQPDGAAAGRLVAERAKVSVFYDMDTPVTLARLDAGETVDYLPEGGLAGFDLALSYTGGPALDRLKRDLGARRAAPLYGWVDPQAYRPVAAPAGPRADLSYIGTYAADRQARLEALFVEAARARREKRFVLAGSGYPVDFPWTDNVWFVRHLPPADHPSFFAGSRMTLNVTRGDMAAMGWCPSGRLFEAAACGCPILSDRFEGLDAFFEPDREILLADDTADALAALDRDDAELFRLARAARDRTLEEHTADRRAETLLALLDSARAPAPALREEA